MDKKQKKSNHKKIILIVLFVIIFLLLIFSVFFSLIHINNNNLLKGISINGIDVSGMSKEEATASISEMISKKSEHNIVISTSEDSQITTTFDYLEINYHLNECINRAYSIGRSGNIFENNFAILDLIFHKKNIELEIELNENNLNSLLDDISANLPNKIIQSSYYIENNQLILTRGNAGDTIDTESFKSTLYKALSDLSLTDTYVEAPIKNVSPNPIDINQIYNEVHKEVQNAYYEKNPFKVYSEVVGISFDKNAANELLQNEQDEYVIDLQYTYPEITINDLDINIFQDTLSYFSTNYNLSDKDRTTNLELASSKINGTILSPGEEFSYNTIVGARTIATGYKEAKIYSNGEVVDGIGGGICQISSTLYNAVIFANLEITERYNHQFVTSYVPAGRDATVVYGVKDLKFVNNRSYPIKIEMKVNNGIVTCSILRNKRRYRI